MKKETCLICKRMITIGSPMINHQKAHKRKGEELIVSKPDCLPQFNKEEKEKIKRLMFDKRTQELTLCEENPEESENVVVDQIYKDGFFSTTQTREVKTSRV